MASYPYERMLTLEQLECIFEQAKAESIPPREQLDPLLLPMDTAVASLPEVNMLAAVAAYVNQGQAVQVAGAPQSGQVRMTVGPEREFIGVGEIDDEARGAQASGALSRRTRRGVILRRYRRVLAVVALSVAKSDGDDYDTALISRLN